MFRLFFIESIRKKWNLVRIFLVVPFVQILPVVTLSKYVTNDYTQDLLVSLFIWGSFYPTFFEIINTRMERFETEKVLDVLLSKYSLTKYNYIEILAINILFIPSSLLTIYFIAKAMNISLTAINFILSIPLIIVHNIVIGTFLVSVQIQIKKYFNKVNLLIDVLYLFVGAVIPLAFFPEWVKILSNLLPITVLIEYAQTQNHWVLLIFLSLICIYFIVGNVILSKSISKFKRMGGSQ